MDVGIVVTIGSDGLRPQAVGRACEERGFLFGVPPDRALLTEFAEAGADRCLLPLTIV